MKDLQDEIKGKIYFTDLWTPEYQQLVMNRSELDKIDKNLIKKRRIKMMGMKAAEK